MRKNGELAKGFPACYTAVEIPEKGVFRIMKAFSAENISVRRILSSLIGVTVVGISVGFFKVAALGVGPFQSFMSGLDALIPISFGTLYVIANAVLILFALIFHRQYIGLGTFINLFFLGYIIEFSRDCMLALLPGLNLPGRIGLLIFAVIILYIGSAFIFTAFFMGPLISFFEVHLARPFLQQK